MLVTKRDGSLEPLDLNKLHQVAFWSCENITGVSASELELKANLSFYDKIPTKEIQETLIKAAADLISEETPNYMHVGSRLINYALRKEVWGGIKPPHLAVHVSKIANDGHYDYELMDTFTTDEWDKMNSFLDHDRDFLIPYVGMEQWRGKYLVRNRVTNEFYETPQIALMLIAASLFSKYDNRLKWIKDYYDAISTFDISLPTPIMAGVRTTQRQFSSCVLIEAADSLDSITATTGSVIKYVSQRAGIGIGGGAIRAIGSPVRNGAASHTGVIPYWKLFQSAVRSCSQGGVRNGAATLYYPIWHLEVEDFLVLKNNKGTEETRIRHLDYGVQFNKLFYERLLKNENITLFSPSDVGGLYEAFYRDIELFRRLYTEAEANPNIRKKVVSARDLFSAFMTERKDTGRVYLMNVDHCNDHGSFYDPIRMSNLCCEITLPTTPLKSMDDETGEIALCTLSAINWGKIREPEDFEKPCTLAVRALDALLDYQDYPVKAARHARARRALGVGIVNLAYWLAKKDLTYQNITPEGLQRIHEYAEAWSYYLIKASMELSKEKGGIGWGRLWDKHTSPDKYTDGILPIDTYKRDVDDLAKPVYLMDWESLRKDLKTHGIRNSTLMALMPAETSAQVSNSTNGIEPVRALVSVKQSKHGVLTQVVPEYRRLKNKYDLLWDQKSPEGYLKICAVLQKFIDQAISVNTSYNPSFYPDNQIPMSEMLRHMLMHFKYGGKTMYYFNTYDGAGELELEDVPLAQDEVVEDDCDSCKI
jgi:ribonucleoside-diphosphate reductase alpha chain